MCATTESGSNELLELSELLLLRASLNGGESIVEDVNTECEGC